MPDTTGKRKRKDAAVRPSAMKKTASKPTASGKQQKTAVLPERNALGDTEREGRWTRYPAGTQRNTQAGHTESQKRPLQIIGDIKRSFLA